MYRMVQMYKRDIIVFIIIWLTLFLYLHTGRTEELKTGRLTIETKGDNSFVLKSDDTQIIQDDYGEISLPGGAPINFIKEGKTQIKEGKDVKKVILSWEKPDTGYFHRRLLLFPKECIILWDLKVKLPKEGRGDIGFFIPEELLKDAGYRIVSDSAWAQQEAKGMFANWENEMFMFQANPYQKPDAIRLGFLELYANPRLSMELAHSRPMSDTGNVSVHQQFLLKKLEDKYRLNLELNQIQLPECHIQAAVRIKVNPERQLQEGKNRPEGLLELVKEGTTITLLRDKRYLFPGEKIAIEAEYISEVEKKDSIAMSYKLTDYYDNVLKEGSYNLLTEGRPLSKIKLFEYQPKETGMYRLKVSYSDPGEKKAQKEKQAIFAVFPRPHVVKDSFFGAHIITPIEEHARIGSDAGIKWIRAGSDWNVIEPENDKFQFKRADEYIEAIRKSGLKIMYILDSPAPWVKGYKYGGPWDMKSCGEFLPDLLEYARQVVTRYKGKIDAYEVINEACIGTIPQEKAEAYFQVLKETYKLIKSIDPNAIVVGIDGSTNLDSYYKLIRLGVLDYLDVVAAHYVIPLTRTPDYGKRITYTPKWYDALREVMHKYGGKEKPIWDTEDHIWLDANFYDKIYPYYGTRDIDADWKSILPEVPHYVEATNRIVKLYLANISKGIRCFDFIGLVPNPMWWSMLEEDRTPTPAVVGYAVLANLIDGDVCQKIIVTPNLQAFVFQREDGKVITAFFGYNLKGEKDAKLILPLSKERLQLINVMGNELPVSGDKNHTILYFSDEPEYIVSKGLSLADIISGFEQAKVTGVQELAIEEPVKDDRGGGIWNLEEGKGTVIKDSTPNHNDGTISGAVWVQGDFGYALEFDGTDDYVEIPHSKSLNITNEITVAVWAKPEINTNHGPMMVKGPSIIGPSYSYRIATAVYADKPEVNAMTWGVSTLASENFMGMDPAPELKKWHYYVLTAKAGGPTKLYVDGKLLQNWPVSPESYLNSFPGYPVRMGMTYDGRYKYKGFIGESKILSRILSEEEVARDYQDNSIKYK